MANLQRAIGSFTEALRFFTAEAAPLDYAMTQNNLGLAYADLPAGDRAANLSAPSPATPRPCGSAPPRPPRRIRRTQNNLGAAYAATPAPDGDWAANLAAGHRLLRPGPAVPHRRGRPPRLRHDPEQPGHRLRRLPAETGRPTCSKAIACYDQALRFRTPEAAPLTTPTTQNNLGIAYCRLPDGDRSANLQQAIACYEQALRFRTPEAAPLDYAATQINLGNAYADFRRETGRPTCSEAIACYEQALPFYTPEAAPLGLRRDPEQPGHRLRRVPAGDRAANLQQAIACYDRGPPVLHRRGRPLRLRRDPEQPGHRLRRPSRRVTGRPTCGRPSPATSRPSRFRTPEAAPLDYARTQNNLGIAYASCRRVTGRPTCRRPSPATSRPSGSTPPRPPPSTTP